MMKTTSILILLLASLVSCVTKQNQPTDDPKIDTTITSSNTEEVADDGPSIYEIRHMEFQRKHLRSYMSSHGDTILWDSRLEDYSSHERIVITYKCLFDSGLVINPTYYSFDTTEIISHNYNIEFEIMGLTDTTFIEISKEDIKDHLTEELMKNAVIYSPYFKGTTDDDSLFHIGTSISVPGTDIGIGLRFSVDRYGNIEKE